MNNDLISREALKDAMQKAKSGHYAAFSDVTLQGIYRVIDKAPTIRPQDDAPRIINVIEYTFELSKDAIIDYNYWNWIKNIIKAGGLK